MQIVIQSTLFITFIKLFTWEPPTCFSSLLKAKYIISFGIIALLGIASAKMWRSFIVGQRRVLELCKTYLREIEKNPILIGIPMRYWTYESLVAHPETDKKRQIEDMPPGLFPCWLFPGGSKHLKIQLTKIEEKLAKWLIWIWPALGIVAGLLVLLS